MGDVSNLLMKNFSLWEEPSADITELSSDDQDLIIDLIETSQNRSIVYETEEKSPLSPVDLASDPSKLVGNAMEDSLDRIKSSQQFLTWYTNIEADKEKEQDGPNYEYVEQLENHKLECDNLLRELDEVLTNLENLSCQYTAVSNKTSALHADCEHLLAEQTRLSTKADVIEGRLNYFLEVNKISQKLRSPVFQVTNDEFIPLLAKLDECIRYMNSNPSYLEADTYLAKYRHNLSRALGMVKNYVMKSFQSATQAVFPKINAGTENSDNALVLYYQKFKANAPRVKTLMLEIEDRVEGSKEYADLLTECHQFYFAQRKSILENCVQSAINDLSQTYARDYCSFMRSGCAFLVHVCEDEYNLFHHFFSTSTPELDEFLQSICSILYDTARPSIIHINHLETLSELCNILSRGLIEEQIQTNPSQLASLTTVVGLLLQDCQERLVYRAHIYIQSDIANFTPSPGDLAYPAKLEMMQSIAENLASQRRESIRSRNSSVSSLTSVKTLHNDPLELEERVSRIGNSPADLHGMWYPSVRRTLLCLSKVYRCVDKSIFQGVCLEALSSCMQSLANAAASIEKTSTKVDAQLFQIKHLLILREQLAPFQIDANLKSLTLDWSKLKDAAIGLLHKRNKMFTLTSNNALLEFIVEGTPQVSEQMLDSKRDVDNNLKLLCEQFISTCSYNIVGSLITFKAKWDAVFTDPKKVDTKREAFTDSKQVSEVVATSQKKIRSDIPLLLKSLKLYLSNQDTEFIIFKPIRNNIIGSFTWLFKVVQEYYSEDERTIIACPSSEEISAQITLLCSDKA